MAADAELDLVEFGAWVEVELIDQTGHTERMSFTVVSEEAADLDSGLLSEQTPLAKAILGRPVGSSAPYSMGDI
jgi:transcription elongation GreA/GreB family factor